MAKQCIAGRTHSRVLSSSSLSVADTWTTKVPTGEFSGRVTWYVSGLNIGHSSFISVRVTCIIAEPVCVVSLSSVAVIYKKKSILSAILKNSKKQSVIFLI